MLGELNIGEVQVQNFGSPADALIRVGSQGEGDMAEQSAESRVRAALEVGLRHPPRRSRRPDRVLRTGASRHHLGVLSRSLAIGIYIWFRFEWQFAIGAIIATLHDLFLVIGMYAILQMEFSLTSIAAVLTIIGYSINDTVVVYDRIRENLRKYKKMPIPELIDLSMNQTLSRTILTGVTTLLALMALYFLGGEVLSGFSFAMIFGILVGTYSSVFVAAPLLILFKLRPGQLSEERVSVNPFAGAEVVSKKKT